MHPRARIGPHYVIYLVFRYTNFQNLQFPLFSKVRRKFWFSNLQILMAVFKMENESLKKINEGKKGDLLHSFSLVGDQ
jgi:hypothetical protein